MVVSFMRIDLGDAQCQHGHGKELEGVLERRAVFDLGEGGVLSSGLCVRGGFEGAKCSLN